MGLLYTYRKRNKEHHETLKETQREILFQKGNAYKAQETPPTEREVREKKCFQIELTDFPLKYTWHGGRTFYTRYK
jgi:hypothetical protein